MGAAVVLQGEVGPHQRGGKVADPAPICTRMPRKTRADGVVSRICADAGLVSVCQTFVFGGQAVAIRACLWREVVPRQRGKGLTRSRV